MIFVLSTLWWIRIRGLWKLPYRNTNWGGSWFFFWWTGPCSVQFSSVLWLNHVQIFVHINWSMSGLPVGHQLTKFTQTHIHWFSDAIFCLSLLCCPSSSCLEPFPALGSFPMCQFFTSGDQSIGVSPLAPALGNNIQDWCPLGWTGWISPSHPRDSQEPSPTPQFKSINFPAHLIL